MKKRMKAIVWATLFLAVALTINAQHEVPVPLQQEKQIKSKALDEVRTISISLPIDYNLSEDTYPVLYLLDGRTHFQHAAGAASFLKNKGIIPDMIIVSIHNVDRARDFSPAQADRIPNSPGADRFLDFVEKELFTTMDKGYRTSGFTILLGHSFGGNLAVHTLNTRPGLFDAFIAVSPYLHFKENYVISEAEKLLKPCKGGKSLYLTVGNEPTYFDPIEAYSSVIKAKTGTTVDYKVEKMLDESHGTTPYISLFKGLKFIFSDWRIPKEVFNEGLKAIDRHMATVTSKYGVSAKTSELVINQLGYVHLQKEETDKAIAVFSENVKRYPGSANVYDSLGEAYEKGGKLEKAASNYARACEIGEPAGDANYPVYKKNLERVKKALESQ